MKSSGDIKLRKRDTVILGLSFMAPALSLLATFSLVMVAGYSWAGVPLAYLIAGLIVIVTAVSFANLSKTHPGGGSVWSYSKDIFGKKLGQLPVWVYLLELLVVPAAALVPVGFFVKDWLGIPPWITVLVAFGLVVLLANTGIKLSFKTMVILFGIQLTILLIFVVSAIVWANNTNTFDSMAVTAISPRGSLMGWAGIIVGAAAAVYSFLGFESPSAMADETNNPTEVIPKSILTTAVLGTFMNTFIAWAFVLAIPTKGLFSLLYYVNPVPAMAGVIWQNIPPFYAGWRHILNIGGTIAGLTGALASITATSRILEKLGEDRIIPKVFSFLSVKRKTPVLAICLIGTIGLFIAEFSPWESIAYLIATGAIPTFFLVNFMNIWQYKGHKLGFGETLQHRVIPILGMLLCLWIILVGLPARMQLLLLIWIAVGFVIVTVRSFINRESVDKENPTQSGKARSQNLVFLILSLIALVICIIALLVWTKYFGGNLLWWHIMAPYASNNRLAIVLTLIFGIIFVGISIFLYIGKRKQVKQNES